MKRELSIYTLAILLISCGSVNEDDGSHHTQSEEGNIRKVSLSQDQFKSMELELGTPQTKVLNTYVEANGTLQVPPQNEASVTAIIGANVTRIMVIEGQKIIKGEPLAYLSHPDLIKLQTDYANNWNDLQYLEQEYKRQKRLYEEEVGSGKAYQKTKGEYLSKQGLVKGYEAQLTLMGLNAQKILDGDIYIEVPAVSPITGYIRKVEIKTGQYVQPETEMFQVVNIDHVHADLMVFEKDVHKVKEGQRVSFSLESEKDREMIATIFAVGKTFEQNPKAVHIHADIENKQGFLIPGMYIRGRILTDAREALVLPEDAIVRDGNSHYIFLAEMQGKGWTFMPIELEVGERDSESIEVLLDSNLITNGQILLNKAYYLMAEMQKEDTGHVD